MMALLLVPALSCIALSVPMVGLRLLARKHS